MPRKRKSGLPTAMIKAFLPGPVRKRRVRRTKSATTLPAKAIRASARAAPKVVKAATGKSAPASRSTRPGTSKRQAAARKPATRRSGTPSPGSIGRGSWRQERFTGVAGSRAYRVYIPLGLRRTTRAPLLLALHGCTQGALDFAAATRFNALADKHKFVVAYPEQPLVRNGQRCWNWFRSGHQARGKGEPAILAGIVRQVTQETARWRIDPERIYVAGISAGGAMSMVLAATYPELFAAVGVHSAPPYRAASGPAKALAAMQGAAVQSDPGQAPTVPMPPLIVFHGTADGTVRPVNAQRIAEQWLAYNSNSVLHEIDYARGSADQAGQAAKVSGPRTSTTSPTRPATARSRRGYRVSRWYSGGRKVLELWVVDGLGHAWSGGSSSGSYSDTRGPRASTEMWKFFDANRSAAGAAAVLVS